MAIYHLHAKIIQRSKGKNAVAAAAYRHAAKIFDEKEQRYWDYTKKEDVIHHEITIAENSPQWVKSLADTYKTDHSKAAEILWNNVEAVEKRKDAQLAREIEFALPIELNLKQNVQLAREFIHDQFALRGMIADWNIHWDEGNPHVHVMLTMRELTGSGFGKRSIEWNDRALLQEWRSKWSEYANFHLRLNQCSVQIDHRSYAEQGIDLVPSTHQGKAVSDMQSRGIATDIMLEANEIRRQNLLRISSDPKVLFNKISSQSDTFTGEQIGQELGRYINDRGKFSFQSQDDFVNYHTNEVNNPDDSFGQKSVLLPKDIAAIFTNIEYHESVFTEKDIAKAIAPYTENAEVFAAALIQVKSSPELIFIGKGNDGQDRYTTQRMFSIENDIQKIADKMRKFTHIHISNNRIDTALNNYQHRTKKTLTGEQMIAVRHILKSTAIACVVGRAGTGKSFSLGAAKAVWEAEGLRVQGVALSGIAADGLSKEAGIVSRTIASFCYAVEKGQLTLNHHDIVIMDEAGMADSISMQRALKIVQEARAKLVLVGDHAQIQPVGAGASFRALIERTGFAEIQTVYRQNELWQREATVAFSAGRISEGLSSYASQNCIHFGKDENDVMLRLVEDWFELRKSNSKELQQYMIIAHRNKDVYVLNQLLRNERIRRGEIAEGYTVQSKSGELKIVTGDRLLFLKNDRRLGVSNGRFASIKSVEFTELGKALTFTVILDGTNKEITINPTDYNDFAHGYSATVHKVQGMTVDHAFVYSGGYFWNRNLTYVAMSRHRETCALYTDAMRDSSLSSLMNRLGRLGTKDSLLDFPQAFAERRGFDVSGILKDLPKKLVAHLILMKDKLVSKVEEIFEMKTSIQKTEQYIEAAAVSTPKGFLISEIQQMPLNKLLHEYVKMEVEQTRLVNAKHATNTESLKSNKFIREKVIANQSAIKNFAAAAMYHPEIKSEIEKLKDNRIVSLAKRGGFKDIQERIENNNLTHKDVQVLTHQLKSKALEHSRSQGQDNDRGGRSQ